MTFPERLRRMRVNSGMTVRSLAQRIGVSASFIYQLEKGESSPSFSTLRKLAEVFHSSMSVFLEDRFPEEWTIVRKGRRKPLFTGEDGCRAELMLFLGPRARRMQPLVLHLDAGKLMHKFIYEHDRDDFVFVCTGTVEISAGDQAHRLEAGDCAYFTFTGPSTIRNCGEGPAELLWVVSPTGLEEQQKPGTNLERRDRQ
ncbi:MAG TPA: XRE family transcriptional regulator [Clostridiales bacterium UBA8153]|nr:XRE family transcriptional regulator [Clostridiales bacterium UBA8153]